MERLEVETVLRHVREMVAMAQTAPPAVRPVTA
jgi:hypothetical protein